MVFFCCDNCGESLKKNQVEKHGYRCRSASYSCLDCQMRFTPNTYAKHVKCITENQKYGGKGYVEKEAKGELKQNAWVEQVERAIEFVKEPALKNLLRNIQGYANIPRKEAKFINFLSNSCKIRDNQLCQRAWKAIAEEAEKLKKEAEETKKAAEEAKASEKKEEVVEEEKKEEQKNGEKKEEESAQTEEVQFKWKAAIKRKLKEAGGEMKVKRLRSAVLSDFEEAGGKSEEARELFAEKLEKAGVTVNGKVAVLA